MILFYMLAGEPPWPEYDGMRAVRLAAVDKERPALARHWDSQLGALVQAAWADEPAQRPSFAAVLEQLNAFHLAQFKCTLEEAIKRGGVPGGGAAGSSCCVLM